MAWRTSPYLGLRVPSSRRIDFADRLAESLGDQVEVLGEQLRMVVAPDQEVSASQLLRLTGPGAAQTVSDGGVVNLVTGASPSGSTVLTSMIGLTRQPGFSAGLEAVRLLAVPPAGVAASAAEAVGTDEPETAFARPISNRLGFAIGDDLVLFDGTAPLSMHGSGRAHDPVLYDPLSVGPAGPAFDASAGMVTYRFAFAAAAKSCDLVFPVHVPADFRDWASDDDRALAVMWFSYAVQATGNVTATVSDDLGNTASAPARSSTAGAFSTYQITPADLDGLNPAPSSLMWLKVHVDSGASWPGGKVSELVQIQTSVHWRYRNLRRYT